MDQTTTTPAVPVQRPALPPSAAQPPGRVPPAAVPSRRQKRRPLRWLVTSVLAFSLGSCTGMALEQGGTERAEQRAAEAEQQVTDARSDLQAAMTDVSDAEAAAESALAAKVAAEGAAADKGAELEEVRGTVGELEARLDDAEEAARARPKAPSPTASSSVSAPAAEEPAGSASYANCTAVRQAGADPIRTSDPGYGRHLDRDGDGVGCE